MMKEQRLLLKYHVENDIMKKIRILIVDDHNLIINGIKSLLSPIQNFEIIGEANDGQQAIDLSLKIKPDVIIMDISMPVLSGIDATKIILEKLPETKVIALTQHEDSEYVIQILNAGGYGYLLKNSKKEEFIDAINTVCEGRKYFSKNISNLLLNDLLENKSAKPKEEPKILLTKREKEIIQKIADELSNYQIADELNISLRTVETHRRNIMQKLNLTNVVSLIKYAVANEIVSLD